MYYKIQYVCFEQDYITVYVSYYLYVAIIKSLIGASDSVTNAVTISRISGFYDDLVQTLKSLDFIDLGFILRVCAYACVLTK